MTENESNAYYEAPDPPAPVMVVHAFQGLDKALLGMDYDRCAILKAFNSYSRAITTDPAVICDPNQIRALQEEGALRTQSARIKANKVGDVLGSKLFAQLNRTYLKNAQRLNTY